MEELVKSLPLKHKLSDYRIEQVLGQGAFGITYLATDLNLMQSVAIKEFYPREFAGRDSTLTVHAVGNREDKDLFNWGLTRFLEESRILAKLHHPNIVAAKRYFGLNGTAYLVMEYCKGEPLDELIKRVGKLDEKQVVEILFPLIDGLDHVHKNDFLHRDIKPANIYIREDGSPVLLDFGAARQEMSSQSKSVTSLATAGYAPFEQYSTKGKQGPWSDIYGLSATMYRALTGERPQDSPDRMLEDHLTPLSVKLKSSINKDLLRGLDLGMSLRPENRPPNIESFRNILLGKKESVVNSSKATIESGTISSSNKAIESKGNLNTVLLFAVGFIFLGLMIFFVSINIQPGKISPQIADGNSSKNTENTTPVLPQKVEANNDSVESQPVKQEDGNNLNKPKIQKSVENNKKIEEKINEEKMRDQAIASARATQVLEDQKNKNSNAINNILNEGEKCFQLKNYGCSKSSANAVLQIQSDEPRAIALRDRADSAQKRALDSITIQ